MTLHWLAEAADDLEGIYNYLIETNPTFASSTVDALYQAARSLKTYPHRGRPGRKTNTHELVMAHLPYIIFYRILGETIEILYIRHGAQDR